ncbi:hypothetical protein [Moraxella lacunata]|uniref:hypothetical protein n=1 Tax=Moraxella lacunata TaxID=477 RepID=UPI003EDF9786
MSIISRIYLIKWFKWHCLSVNFNVCRDKSHLPCQCLGFWANCNSPLQWLTFKIYLDLTMPKFIKQPHSRVY